MFFSNKINLVVQNVFNFKLILLQQEKPDLKISIIPQYKTRYIILDKWLVCLLSFLSIQKIVSFYTIVIMFNFYKYSPTTNINLSPFRFQTETKFEKLKV